MLSNAEALALEDAEPTLETTQLLHEISVRGRVSA